MRATPRQNFKIPKAEQSLTYCRKLKTKTRKTPMTLVSISSVGRQKQQNNIFKKFQRKVFIIPEYYT